MILGAVAQSAFNPQTTRIKVTLSTNWGPVDFIMSIHHFGTQLNYTTLQTTIIANTVAVLIAHRVPASLKFLGPVAQSAFKLTEQLKIKGI